MMLYADDIHADDLCLVFSSTQGAGLAAGLQGMLNAPSIYSHSKQLVVNTDRSQIMVFNAR